MQSSGHSILIVNAADLDCTDFRTLTFAHPKDGSATVFITPDGGPKNGVIFELQTAQPYKYGSWFINQRISSDSCFYFASPFDMRFLCLPFLVKSKERYSPLDQIITSGREAGVDRIPIEHVRSWHLEEICDVNNKFEDMILYKYNEEKTLALLQRKSISIAEALSKQRKAADIESCSVSTFKTEGSSASGFNNSDVDSSKNSSAASSNITYSNSDLIIALQILGEYVSDDLISKLCSKVGLDELELKSKSALSVKRKAQWELDLEVEKQSMEYLSRPSSSHQASSHFNSSSSSHSSSHSSSSSNGGGYKPQQQQHQQPQQKKATPAKPIIIDNKTPKINSFFMKK